MVLDISTVVKFSHSGYFLNRFSNKLNLAHILCMWCMYAIFHNIIYWKPNDYIAYNFYY